MCQPEPDPDGRMSKIQEGPFLTIAYIVTMWLQFGFNMASVLLQYCFKRDTFNVVFDEINLRNEADVKKLETFVNTSRGDPRV